MVSQVIGACTTLIPYGTVQFIQNTFVLLGVTYDTIRNKNIVANRCRVMKTFNLCNEDHNITHIGLDVLIAARRIVVKAIERDNFNAHIVSGCSYHMVAESGILDKLNCKCQPAFVLDLNRAVDSIAANIGKIIATCGDERGQRTLEKLASLQSLHSSTHSRTTAALIKVCERRGDKALLINLLASKLLCSTDEKNRRHNIYQLHLIQKDFDDPANFETIPAILKRLPTARTAVNHPDASRLLLSQLACEILYPILNNVCRRKLIEDVCEMDLYNDDRCCYINLLKSAVCYLQYTIDKEHYKSNVLVSNLFEQLNDKFVSLNNELNVVQKLRESLDCLQKFLASKDVWSSTTDKDNHISLAEQFLQLIGECLINRHYKDWAITAFDSLYRLAKVSQNPLKQMVAAGYLVENMNLKSTLTEQEIVTELQSIVMQKLKDVTTMGDDELGNFLLSFLQLTMYTMRFQQNIEHTKKYMQAINKLLDKYDRKKEKYVAARLKYSEVMFEMIVSDSAAQITPITFIEDIFHRFQSTRSFSAQDSRTVSGITFDLISTLYAFTRPRYVLRYGKSLIWTIHTASLRNGYLLLFAKTTILTSSECLLVNGKHLEVNWFFLCTNESSNR